MHTKSWTNSVTCEDCSFQPLCVHIIKEGKASSWIFKGSCLPDNLGTTRYLYVLNIDHYRGGNYSELTGARCCAKHLHSLMIELILNLILMTSVRLSSPNCRWWNWSPQRLSNYLDHTPSKWQNQNLSISPKITGLIIN